MSYLAFQTHKKKKKALKKIVEKWIWSHRERERERERAHEDWREKKGEKVKRRGNRDKILCH